MVDFEKRGRRQALILVGVGLLVSAALLAAFGALDLVVEFPIRILVGLGVTVGLAVGLGAKLGPVVAPDRADSYLIGAAFALVTVVCGVTAGSSLSLLLEADSCRNGVGECFYDWVFKPLYWVTLYGGVPAAVLGAIYTFTVGHVEADKPAPGPRRKFLVAGAVFVFVAPFVAQVAFVGRTETVTREMRWMPLADDDSAEVTLVFVDAPNHYVRLESKPLRDWLATREDRLVRAELKVRSDFGRVSGYSLQRIEGWSEDLGSANAGGGMRCGGEFGSCVGPEGESKSPW